MTNFFSVLLILTLTTLVSAQTEQGNFLIGGSSNFSTGGGSSKTKTDNYESDPTKFISFNLSPKGGFFVIDNLAIGASLPLSISRSKLNDTKRIITGIGFLPFARYYFLDGDFRPLAEAFMGFGFNGDKTKTDGNTDTDNSGGFLFGFGGGVAYFINETFCIDAQLRYGFTRLGYSDRDDNYRTLDHEIGIDVGIIIIL